MELNAGTVDDIIQYIIGRDIAHVADDRIDTLLLSFHLYTTVYCLLTTLDAKFWHLCFDSNVYPDEKFRLIRSLTKVLDRWLDNPHIESFYSPPDFLDLKRLSFVASQWLRVFATNFQPIRRKHSKSEEFSQSQLIMKARDFIRSMSKSYQLGLAQVMEEICTKINMASDRFHRLAGLFREANCDKDASEASTESRLRISLREGSMSQLSPRHIAEQLTLYDADLFLKVLPSECLNYVRHRPAPTVDSTIRQFNRIYGLVLTTIIETDPPRSVPAANVSASSLASLTLSIVPLPLQNGRRKISNHDGRQNASLQSSSNITSCQNIKLVSSNGTLFRAEMLSKWISIAAELRTLRSFSAFTAVMTALQGYAISSLHETWRYVESHYPEKKEIFHNLSQLLNLEDNKKYARELLDHMYSSYEIGHHQDSRHCILSTIFRRKIGADYLPENARHSRGAFRPNVEASRAPLQHEEIMMKTVGTIPYLGIFLNDLAMLHESAPDRLPRHKPTELRRPTSGSSLTSMARDRRNNHNNLHNQQNQGHHNFEPLSALPLLSTEPPRRPSRRKRANESFESGTGSACGAEPSQQPPLPVLINHRSRKGSNNNETGSSTTPTPTGVIIPRDKRGRQARATVAPPLPLQRRRGKSALATGSKRRECSIVSPVASTTVTAATAIAALASENDDLINFRKHWREYKVLAKLMYLQSSATRYKIREDVAFRQWFESFVLISESGANQRARELEPPPPRNRRDRMDTVSGSLEVLFRGGGVSDDDCQMEELPRSRLSSPLSHSPRLSRLPPCGSANSKHSNDKSAFDEYDSRKVIIKGSLKRSNQKPKRRSSSVSDLNATSVTPLLRAHHQLSLIKNKINGTLHYPRSSPSTPNMAHIEDYTRF
ncbi:ral guanine nucleotide dissociation [Echinococcus multilocularis]|uniref:Ral guanine nucleotide dissociation n=1 Tax=Echinococcus multilocularis TaxID=6211 RepID=A0A068Y8B2_ECHMU|nr:ral guanine nucleotide dissociation [Echinococcus multilocularis]